MTSGITEYGHDIAFHPSDGNLYVTYCDVGGTSKLKYYVLTRLEPSDHPGDFSLLNDAGPFDAAYNGNNVRNYWFPSMDIGMLDDMPDVYNGGNYADNTIMVGVACNAYKFAGDNDTYYRTAGNYWAPSSDGYTNQYHNTTSFQNTDFTTNDAGMPSFDIMPNNSLYGHYFAIAYVQEVDETHVYEIWEVDNLFNDATEIVHVGALNRQQALPSIAIHYSGTATKYASISMYENESSSPSGSWKAWTCAIKMNDHTIPFGSWGFLEEAITGSFTLGSIATNKAGTGSSIVLTSNNTYWFTYGNTVDNSTCDIYAARGSTL